MATIINNFNEETFVNDLYVNDLIDNGFIYESEDNEGLNIFNVVESNTIDDVELEIEHLETELEKTMKRCEN